MEEPAAPITATIGTVRNHKPRQLYRGEQLTIMAESNKLDIKDTAVILPDAANADSITLGELTVKTGLRAVRLVKDADGWVGCRGAS